MHIITKDSGFNQLIYDFKDKIKDLLEDPVITDPFEEAVTLIPCGHHLGQTVAEKIFQKNQQCPLDHQKFEKYIPNLFLRQITSLLSKDIHDFYVLFLKAFEKANLTSPKVVTLFSCGHSLNGVDTDSGTAFCHFDQIPITTYATSHIVQDIVHITAIFQKKMSDMGKNKPSFYFQLLNPRVSLETLNQIPIQFFHQICALEPDNVMICYNLARRLIQEIRLKKNASDQQLQRMLLIKATVLEPQFADVYYELGIHLGKTGHLDLGIGKILDSLAFFSRAIQFDPDHVKSYLMIALWYPDLEALHGPTGEVLSMKEILLKAIHFFPKEGELYMHLSQWVGMFGDAITLLDNRVLNYKEILEIFIKISPTHPLAYDARCRLAGLAFYVNHKVGSTKASILEIKQMLLEAIDINPKGGQAYQALALVLQSHESIRLRNGQVVDQRTLILQAIELEPNCGGHYMTCAQMIRPEEKITLLNRQVMTGKQLMAKGLELDPTCAIGYLKHSQKLSPLEAMTLPMGKAVGKIQIWAAVFSKLFYSEESSSALSSWMALEEVINNFPKGSTIKLEDGSIKSEKQIYQMVIEKYPKCSVAYYKLGLLLLPQEKVAIKERPLMGKEELFIEAIRTGPYCVQAYEALAQMMPKGKTVSIVKGKNLTKQQLLIEGIRSYPTRVDLYYYLGLYTELGHTVQLPSQEKLQKMDLFLKAIEIDPNHAKSYHAIADMLSEKGTIVVAGQGTKNRLELYLKAVKLDPHYESISVIAKKLISFMQGNKPLVLSNGKELTVQEFLDYIGNFIFLFHKFYGNEVQQIPKELQAFYTLSHKFMHKDRILQNTPKSGFKNK